MEFTDLEMHPDIRRAIDDAGYLTCTPVQASVFPHAFKGEDIFAQSQTGTGKTAAFLVSIFQRIMTVPEVRTRKVLVLAPTRELAVQIEGEAKRLGKYLPVSSFSFYGGVGYGPQVDQLRANVQMIIGTPGRIIDLIQQGKMILREVGFLVIDEADRMFDMGFVDDLRRLIRYLPPPSERQTYLFSATLGLRVKDLAWEYMVEPHEITIEPEHVTVELVTQELHHVGAHEKLRLLLGILERENPSSALIFCNQKNMVEELARRLKINGVDCEYIMGDLPQSKRLEIIDRLKAGRLRILVATDVAARGLDVQALDLVVNYDVPNEAEAYVHRIGRTARAGKAGKAITLACEKFVYGLPAIEKFIGFKIPSVAWDPALYREDRSQGMRFHRDLGRGDRGPAPRGYGRGGYGHGAAQAGRPDRGGRGAERRHLPRGGENRRSVEGVARPGEPRASQDNRREAWRDDRPELRREERPEAGGRGGQGSRRGERRPVNTGGQGDGREPRPEAAPGAPPPGEPNPYAMSQDERLKRFKQKYAEGSPGDSHGGQGQSPAPRGQSPAGPARGQSSAVSPRGQSPAGSPRGQSPASPAAPPARKPGILDRIKGIFGGKKKD